MPSGQSTPLIQRVEVGAYYTDGRDLWKVTRVYEVGAVDLIGVGRNAESERQGVGIDAFRRRYWLAKPA